MEMLIHEVFIPLIMTAINYFNIKFYYNANILFIKADKTMFDAPKMKEYMQTQDEMQTLTVFFYEVVNKRE